MVYKKRWRPPAAIFVNFTLLYLPKILLYISSLPYLYINPLISISVPKILPPIKPIIINKIMGCFFTSNGAVGLSSMAIMGVTFCKRHIASSRLLIYISRWRSILVFSDTTLSFGMAYSSNSPG